MHSQHHVSNLSTASDFPKSVAAFLRAKPEDYRKWVVRRQWPLAPFCIATIAIGAGAFGAAMGGWRDSLQALYTGIKLPLVILLTTLGNGLLNGMLAPLLGLNITFRQSLTVVLMSFAVAAIVLGALSPVMWFVVWNTPPLTTGTSLSSPEYGFLQLTLAAFIALAGVLGNVRLLPLLEQWTGNVATARNLLLAWLTANLFLGSQIAWVLRPFIWDPSRPVEFVGREYFRGSFFETIFNAVCRLVFS